MKFLNSREDIILLSLILMLSTLLGLSIAFVVSQTKLPFTQNISSVVTLESVANLSSSTNGFSSIVSSSSEAIVGDMKMPVMPSKPKTEVAGRDYLGQKITNFLKNNGYNMGYLWSTDLEKVSHPSPINPEINKAELDKFTQPKNISEIVPKPIECEKKNWLSFPKYATEAPINYASFQDMYNSDKNKYVNLNNPIQESQVEINKGNYLSVPVQRLLVKGVVHLPESPHPGQVGNSYIVGHTSNFPQVRSDFNYVFKSFERKSKVGDEFFVWDSECRKLKFKVFEVSNILAEDINTAYKNFGDRRIVTLQGSILDANYQPTRRWLTRGELVLE
jgi:sortase (surface protein transpeptidase)